MSELFGWFDGQWSSIGPSFIEFVWAAMFALLRPSTVIAGLGPYLINLSIKILRGNVSIEGIDAPPRDLSEIRRILRDEWVAALRNWAIQIYTVMLTMITVLFEMISTTIAALRHPNLSLILANGGHELKYLVAAIITLAGIGWSAHLVLSSAPRKEVVSLYLPPTSRPYAADFSRPPLRSPLTWARATLIVVGWVVYATARKLGVLT